MCVLRLHAITSRSMGKQKEIKVPKKFETQAASSMVLTKTRTYFLVGLSLSGFVCRSKWLSTESAFIYLQCGEFFPHHSLSLTFVACHSKKLSLSRKKSSAESKISRMSRSTVNFLHQDNKVLCARKSS